MDLAISRLEHISAECARNQCLQDGDCTTAARVQLYESEVVDPCPGVV